MYRRYLGIEADDKFFFNAMEFPFLVERHGEVVARVPNSVDSDGAIHFVADLEEGETIDFGYAHVDTILRNVSVTLDAVREFEPEAIGIYSCGCRHFVMQHVTGLCNRRVLESRLEDEIARSRRHNRGCCIIFADIDNFKQLNDGVACFPANADTPADILVAADQALYEAKHAGRNRVCSAG